MVRPWQSDRAPAEVSGPGGGGDPRPSTGTSLKPPPPIKWWGSSTRRNRANGMGAAQRPDNSQRRYSARPNPGRSGLRVEPATHPRRTECVRRFPSGWREGEAGESSTDTRARVGGQGPKVDRGECLTLSPSRLRSSCPTDCPISPAICRPRASWRAVIIPGRAVRRRPPSCRATYPNGFTRLRSWVRVPQRPPVLWISQRRPRSDEGLKECPKVWFSFRRSTMRTRIRAHDSCCAHTGTSGAGTGSLHAHLGTPGHRRSPPATKRGHPLGRGMRVRVRRVPGQEPADDLASHKDSQ
jgi:hypothetical protein